MNFRKAYCLYHEEELITNFCRDKRCLMPLCPSCIRQHTQYHQEIKTKPSYYNIYQTVAEVKEMIYSSISTLQQDKARNAEIEHRIKSWSNNVKQTIANMQRMVHSWVDQQFKHIEQEIVQKFAKIHEDAGIHTLSHVDKFDKAINKTLIELYDLFDSMKNEKFLGSMIVFLEEKQAQVLAFHNKFAVYQHANERYSPLFQVSKTAKNQLSACLYKMFRIETKIEKNQDSSRRSKSPGFKNKNKTNLDEKIQKLERSYTPQRSAAYVKQAPQTSQLGLNKGVYSNCIYRGQGSYRGQFSFEHSQIQNISHLSSGTRSQNSVYRELR